MQPHGNLRRLASARMSRVPILGGSRSSGFSLIELLIAMAIGILVLFVISQSYLSGMFVHNQQSEELRVHESARFASELLARSIRRSGYRNTWAGYPSTYNYSGFPQDFCATSATGSQMAGKTGPSTIDPAAASMTGATVAIANASDVIRIRGYGEDNATGTAADGSVLDCLGNSIRRGQLVEETLYVANDNTNNNEPALYCRTSFSGGSSAPLVPGVERLKLLYGEDTDGDGVINRYVDFANLTPGTGPDNVREVMISMVVRSPDPVSRQLTTTNRSFSQFESTFTAPSDNRLRRVFSTTVALRNFRQC